MASAQEIQKIMDEERVKFNQEIYEGSTLPPNLVKMFKKSILGRSTKEIQVSEKYLLDLIKKPVHKLTNLDVATILNRIIATPLKELFPTVEESLEYIIELKQHVLKYNIISQQMEQELKRKEDILKGNPIAPMHIIKN